MEKITELKFDAGTDLESAAKVWMEYYPMLACNEEVFFNFNGTRFSMKGKK